MLLRAGPGDFPPVPLVVHMAFLDDIDTDRDTVFLNSLEFAEAVDYRVAATDTTTVGIIAEIEDEGDDVLTDGLLARISEDVIAAPIKGDQIIRGGKTFTVVFVTEEQGVFTLDLEREEEVT